MSRTAYGEVNTIIVFFPSIQTALQLVTSLPGGVTLTVVIDACHSGSVLDLPYCILVDEGTIAAVESGEQSSVIGVNPGLTKV